MKEVPKIEIILNITQGLKAHPEEDKAGEKTFLWKTKSTAKSLHLSLSLEVLKHSKTRHRRECKT